MHGLRSGAYAQIGADVHTPSDSTATPSRQGGAGSRVAEVPEAEQNYQGGKLSAFYRDNGVGIGDPYDVGFEP